jgi:hypothetical protein
VDFVAISLSRFNIHKAQSDASAQARPPRALKTCEGDSGGPHGDLLKPGPRTGVLRTSNPRDTHMSRYLKKNQGMGTKVHERVLSGTAIAKHTNTQTSSVHCPELIEALAINPSHHAHWPTTPPNESLSPILNRTTSLLTSLSRHLILVLSFCYTHSQHY